MKIWWFNILNNFRNEINLLQYYIRFNMKIYLKI